MQTAADRDVEAAVALANEECGVVVIFPKSATTRASRLDSEDQAREQLLQQLIPENAEIWLPQFYLPCVGVESFSAAMYEGMMSPMLKGVARASLVSVRSTCSQSAVM